MTSPATKTIGMTIVRVILSLIILKDLVVYFFAADQLFGPNAIVPFTMYYAILKQYGLLFFEFPFDNLLYTKVYILGCLSLTGLFLVGIRTSLTGIALFFFLLFLKMRNIFILDGGDNLLQVMLPLVALGESLPLLERTSPVPVLPGRLGEARATVTLLANYGIMLEVCYVYFFAFLHKLPGTTWLDGTATYYVMRTAEFQGTPLNIWLTQSALFVKSTTYATLVWEASFPIILRLRGRPKYFLLAFSTLMHLSILVFMRIDNYSIIMIATYAAFLTNEEFVSLARKMKLLPFFSQQPATAASSTTR